MKTEEYSKFIVKLNYQWLARQINKDKIYNFDIEDFTDQALLKAFCYYKGTKHAINLLGSVLKNIENSLEIIIFDGDDNYPLKGDILYRENDCCIYGDGGNENDEERIIEYTQKIRPLFIKESKDTIKYYKEYFLRIYDRSRTA